MKTKKVYNESLSEIERRKRIKALECCDSGVQEIDKCLRDKENYNCTISRRRLGCLRVCQRYQDYVKS